MMQFGRNHVMIFIATFIFLLLSSCSLSAVQTDNMTDSPSITIAPSSPGSLVPGDDKNETALPKPQTELKLSILLQKEWDIFVLDISRNEFVDSTQQWTNITKDFIDAINESIIEEYGNIDIQAVIDRIAYNGSEIIFGTSVYYNSYMANTESMAIAKYIGPRLYFQFTRDFSKCFSSNRTDNPDPIPHGFDIYYTETGKAVDHYRELTRDNRLLSMATSPDESELIFYDSDVGGYYIFDFVTRETQKLSEVLPNQDWSKVCYGCGIQWLPDNKLIYVDNANGKHIGCIYDIGTGERDVLDEFMFYPQMSEDGKWVAYIKESSDCFAGHNFKNITKAKKEYIRQGFDLGVYLKNMETGENILIAEEGWTIQGFFLDNKPIE